MKYDPRRAPSVRTSPSRGEVKAKTVIALVAFFTAQFASPALRAQPANIRAAVEGAPKQVALSGSVRVTLVLEGPKPLRVELPKQLLTADANGAWRIRPDGPAQVAAVANDREQWRQTYRLDPYAEGKPLVASFSPVTVNGQAVTWPAVAVEVTKSVGDLATTPPRAPVGTEEPPDPTKGPERSFLALGIVGAVGGVLALVLVAVLVRKRRADVVPPHERALTALEKLLAAEALGAEAVGRVATVLRRFVEQRFAIPAPKLTTTELLAAAGEQGWPVEQAEPLRAVLDECDRAKFAGDVPDDDGCRRLVSLAVDWVHDISRPAGPG